MKYSPLHNVKPGASYPPTLVTTSDHDDRVAPAHSFKFAAAMQAAQAGRAPVLIRIETKAGHGAGKPTSEDHRGARGHLRVPRQGRSTSSAGERRNEVTPACCRCSFIAGNAGSPTSRRTASCGRSNGGWTGCHRATDTTPTPQRSIVPRQYVDRRAARHAGVVHAAARRPTTTSLPRSGDGIVARPVSQRADDAAPREQPRHDALLPGPRDAAAARRAVLVLPQWNADEEGHVGLCRLLARFGMSALRLSLPYHDTRMPPELARADYIVSAEHRAHARGLPAGGARRATGHRVAGAPGLRPHRHPRHQPRLVPVDAHDVPRAADHCAGAESHLALFRRRRVARALHAPRA